MPANYYPMRSNFGLLPEPEGRSGSFITSCVINALILALAIYIGATAKKVLEEHKYENTILIVPSLPPPPPPKVEFKPPPQPPPPTKAPDVKLEMKPRIKVLKPEPKPDVKPLQMEAKVALPEVKAAKPAVILARQPKAALTAAMPAQDSSVKPSTTPVHLGETFGVTPNPNATKPATVAAIGNPYGGMQGPAVAPHGVVGSTGIGNGTRSGSNAGTVGKVASAGLPGSTGNSSTGGTYGNAKVGSAGIPATAAPAPVRQMAAAAPAATDLEVLSKPAVQYTNEARQMKVQGDVVLRVTFTAAGRVVVQGLVHGLGHGLDEEARKVAEQIRFRPATRNGQAVDLTTNITISFQLA
jgi:TonB family protein